MLELTTKRNVFFVGRAHGKPCRYGVECLFWLFKKKVLLFRRPLYLWLYVDLLSVDTGVYG